MKVSSCCTIGFIFLLLLGLVGCKPAGPNNCFAFQKGEFRMQHEGASYSISRTDSTQVERSDLGDFTDQYWIGWASDCQYRIALIETDRPETMRLTAKDTLTFTIVETTGNSRYEYEFELDGHAFTGEVSAVR